MATIITISSATRFYNSGSGDLVEAHNTSVTNLNAELITKLPLAGGTMTGDVNMDGHKITNLPAPVNNSDAARKQDTIPGPSSIVTSMIADANVTLAKMAGSSVDASKIVDGAVTTAKLEYKEYVALITQSGTSAPSQVIIANTLGVTPSWSRVSAGIYQITASGLFTLNKTVAWITNVNAGVANFTSIGQTDVNKLTVVTINSGGTETDAILSSASLCIRVYP